MEIKNFVISKFLPNVRYYSPFVFSFFEGKKTSYFYSTLFAPNRFCSMTHHPLKTNTLRPNAHNYVSKVSFFTETRTIKIAGLSPTREQK